MQSSLSNHKKMQQAIPFIVKNPNTSTYQITKQAQDLLKKIQRPLTVVSVAGLYRTGKSYLLNRVILDKKNVFGVGPTVNPCTKGLWMWIQSDPTASNRDLLVIDTQGLGALDEESNHDMKIFCLAVLLSTTFIYNSVGSIDENALQSLSLVLNLVSNIDQDNSLSRPNFIWVVRDFSLQLVNGDGMTLSPKQYLEMALTTNIKEQQKASIRKTITNAFSDRDCFTLVKPLIDELRLQNLDEIPTDQLRPQFVSQSIELRNKIKYGLRSFSLQSKSEVQGKQYILIVKKYIDAINEGAVPNIVDTWAFIKEEKCRQALDETKKIYTERINSKIMSRVPLRRMHAEQLWSAMKEEIKSCFIKQAFYEYEASTVYEQNRGSFDGLQDFLKNAESHIMRVNHEQGQKYLKMMLTKDYEPFCKKLFSQYYTQFEEFSKDLKENFKGLVIQKYNDKVDNISEQTDKFIDAKLIENFQFFQKNLKDEIRKLSNIKEELENTMNNQISQISEGRDKDRRKLQERIFELQKQINLLENENYQLKETSKSDKEIVQSKLKMLKRKSDESMSNVQELTRQISRLNIIQNELKQKMFLENKEFQKERALFEQKNDYQQKKIQEIQAKNIDLEAKINETGGKYESERKGILRQYQQKLTSLETENRSLLDRNTEAEFKIGKLTNQLNSLTDEIQAIKKNNICQKRNWEERIMKAESNKKGTALERELQQQNQEIHRQLERIQEKLNEETSKMKSINEKYKQLQANSQKQIAIHCQKIQFQEIQLKDFENRYNQLKVSYQKTLESLQDSSKSSEHNSELRMLEIKSQHQKQLERLESEFEDRQKILKKQLQMSQKIAEEMQLQISLEKKSSESKQREWRESNNILQNMCKKLEEKIKSSEKDFEDIFKEKQSFYLHRIKKLEQENDETKEKATQEIDEIKRKSEEALSVLKHYSQIEKQQWEKRYADDREKAEKKVNHIREDYEKRIQEDKAAFEEEVSDLQERLAHMDRVFNERLQNMQYDHDIQIQKLSNNFTEIKVEKEKKIALLEQELQIKRNTFERQMGLKVKQFEQNLATLRESLTKEYEQRIEEIKQAQEHLKEKYETLKKQNRQLEQTNLIIKNQSDKQRALYKQKEKNLQKKIIQLENKLEEELTTFNSVIEKINEKNSIERGNLNQQIQKLNREILDLQKASDKQEKIFENQRSKFEMSLKYFNEQKQKSREDYEDIMHKFQVTVQNLTKKNNELKSGKNEEIKQLTEGFQKEKDNLVETHAKYDKDQKDRINRLTTENKSLKNRLMVLESEKSGSNSRMNYPSQDELSKKRIEEYKELLEKEKEVSRKLKQENQWLKAEKKENQRSQTSIYYQRPSFSEVSNSRISQPSQQKPTYYNEMKGNIYFNNERRESNNRMDRSMNKKFNNTPLIHKKRAPEVQEFQEYSRHSKY